MKQNKPKSKKERRVYLNTEKTIYCKVRLYATREAMREEYKKCCPFDKNHDKVLGVHWAYTRWKPKDRKSSPQSGEVFLSLENCGAGVVTHELMHAVLWGYKHSKRKKQYPIIIKDIKEEELILRYYTLAVQKFYDWYWKITKNGKFITYKS